MANTIFWELSFLLKIIKDLQLIKLGFPQNILLRFSKNDQSDILENSKTI